MDTGRPGNSEIFFLPLLRCWKMLKEQCRLAWDRTSAPSRWVFALVPSSGTLEPVTDGRCVPASWTWTHTHTHTGGCRWPSVVLWALVPYS